MDSISSKPVSGRDRQVAPVARNAPAAKVADARQGIAAEQLKLSAIAFGFGEQTPPVDHERVSRIRAAVRTGTFPINPAKIADRLIALKLEWTPHDGK